jgi:hypothetical protein
MKIYRGVINPQTGPRVMMTGSVTSKYLDPCLHLRNHSPDGLAWGYPGSGPSQLALALCVDVLEDEQHALDIYQQFKDTFIAFLPMDEPWTASDTVLRALMLRVKRRGYAAPIDN